MPATGRPVGRTLGNRKILTFLRFAVAAAFIVASWQKILYPDAFADIIENYLILPIAVVPLVAVWLPWTELFAGVVLVVGVWTRAMGLLLSVLMFVFIAGLVQAMARGVDLHCGCFSLDPQAAARSWASLWQEFLLLAACLWLWIGHWKEPARPREEEKSTD